MHNKNIVCFINVAKHVQKMFLQLLTRICIKKLVFLLFLKNDAAVSICKYIKKIQIIMQHSRHFYRYITIKILVFIGFIVRKTSLSRNMWRQEQPVLPNHLVIWIIIIKAINEYGHQFTQMFTCDVTRGSIALSD